VELVRELENYGVAVSVHDPIIGAADLQKLSLRPVSDPFQPPQPNQPNKPNEPNEPYKPQYDAVILAVPHRALRGIGPNEYLSLLKDDGMPGVFVDVKAALARESCEKSGVLYWSL
jgi:hypothetical protein